MLREKLISDIYKWVAGNGKVPPEKEKLLKMMIQATLDYLHQKGLLKEDGKSAKVEKVAK